LILLLSVGIRLSGIYGDVVYISGNPYINSSMCVKGCDAGRRFYGVKGLREPYKKNLELVLKYVATLVDRILGMNPDARIVITSGHGELLSKEGLFSHGIDYLMLQDTSPPPQQPS